MNTKFKKVITALAAGLITVGTVGVLSACGSKAEQPHQHVYVEHAALSATCETPGYEAYFSCQGCEKYFDLDKIEINGLTEIPALGHELESVEAVYATMTRVGYKYHFICEHAGCDKWFYSDGEEADPENWIINAGLLGGWKVVEAMTKINDVDTTLTYDEWYALPSGDVTRNAMMTLFNEKGLTFYEDKTIMQMGVKGTWEWEEQDKIIKTQKGEEERTYTIRDDGLLECTWFGQFNIPYKIVLAKYDNPVIFYD